MGNMKDHATSTVANGFPEAPLGVTAHLSSGIPKWHCTAAMDRGT